MKTKQTSSRSIIARTQIMTVLLGMAAVAGSFFVGVQTAGDVETVSRSRAEGSVLPGDMNGDTVVTIDDVIVLLEITEGYQVPSDVQNLADPNADGMLTVGDALIMLYDLVN